MPHGSVVELNAEGAPRSWLAPGGATIADITPGAVRLWLPGVLDREVSVGGPVEAHPVLGPVQAIRVGQGDGEPIVARVAATDWTRPARLPAIDAPARVPASAGTALLNVLAIAAQVAGRTLRYAGPYPTAALWATLRQCFRAPAGADEAAFTAGVLERALVGAAGEVPIDLTPAPFERVQVAARAVVHLRDGVERLYLGGQAWVPGGVRRLVAAGEGVRAELWIGGAPWAEVAVLDRDGRLVAGPRPLPAVRSAALGRAFPPELRQALGELMSDGEPPLLAAAMREVLRDLEITWGDPGADAARILGGVLVVHAGLWERLGGGPVAALAQALAAALAPPVKLLGQQRLAALPLDATVH
jgi:hypothetical protein